MTITPPAVGVLGDDDDGDEGYDDVNDDGEGWSGWACARYAERSRGKCLIGLA